MRTRIIFIERKHSASVSIERVFRQVAKDLSPKEYDVQFQAVPFGNGILAIIKNILFFRRWPADIYHVTGDIHYISLVMPKNRTVLTIHDLVFLHRRSGLRRWVLKKLFLDLPLRKLEYITVVSQAVKDEIIKYSDIDAGRIAVIDDPLIDRFFPGEIKTFDRNCPTILQIGTAENKNLVNLISALRGIKCRLRIVGPLNDRIIRCLNLNGVVYENIFDLDDDQIIQEYRNADIVSFCSTYEGFGLPIIEGQAIGKPVVTGNLPPMNAVAGNAAVLVDPNDVSSIRYGLLRLINEPEYRKEMIRAGSKNIERFGGKAIAAKYAAVYKRMLDNCGIK